MSGKIIQEIRKNKGLSQAYVLDSLMTQSAYSKFERGQTEIRASVFTNLLMKLEMRLEEFTYIQNGYKQSNREHIIQRYFTMQYNNKTVLQDVLNLAQDYLQTNTVQDEMIQDIYYLCQAFLTLLETKHFSAASSHAEKVWERLSKHDTLYITDLYMLNSILFIFPLTTVLEIRTQMENTIAKYNNSFQLQRIRVNVFINIGYLFMKSKQFENALVELDLAVILCKSEKTYLQLAICYIRKGVCLNQLHAQGQDFIEKGKLLLHLFEEEELLEILENEIIQFSYTE